MFPRSVFCIATSRGRADCILHDLVEAGFSSTEISVLFLDERKRREDLSPAGAPEDATAMSPSAGPIRGVLAWIDGAGPLTVPGVGRFIAAGPLMIAMQGNGARPTLGGIAGGLVGFGLPSAEAGRYAARIKESEILVSIRTDNPDKSDRAREIFTAMEAKDICTIVDVTTPKSPLRGASNPARVTAA